MSGHSKWSTIKRKKEATDAKRGQMFTKISREISVAAREGGPDIDSNFRLRLAVQKARAVNMPADNIKRAIDKAASDTNNSDKFEEVIYEGYGPAGAAVLVSTLTDNRNRTVSDVRSAFSRMGGHLGENGSVSWVFDQRGLIAVELEDGQDADEVSLAAIEAGAIDVNEVEDNVVEVYTDMQNLKAVEEALVSQGFNVTSSELTYIPKTTVEPAESETATVLRLIDRLEDLDDVQGVYTNAQLGDEAEIRAQA